MPVLAQVTARVIFSGPRRPEERKKHEVRFWIRADGRVTRIEVSPPIRDSGYRRVFMETMWNFVFSPAKTRDGRPIDYVYGIVVYP